LLLGKLASGCQNEAMRWPEYIFIIFINCLCYGSAYAFGQPRLQLPEKYGCSLRVDPVNFYSGIYAWLAINGHVLEAAAAAPQLLINDIHGTPSRCASAITSDSCLILTNIHCLADALRPELGPPVVYQETSPNGEVSYAQRSLPTGRQALGAISIDGKNYEIELVASGNADFNDWSDNSKILGTKDWAVVRAKSFTCTGCLTADFTSPLGMSTTAIGYPGKTRGQLFNAKGEGEQNFSPGRYYKSMSENPEANSWQRARRNMTAAQRADSEQMLFSSATISEGNSGGPQVDNNGKLRAISESILVKDGQSDSSEGAGAAIPISLIRDQMAPDVAAKVFSCRR
jgi:hypothetical protein